MNEIIYKTEVYQVIGAAMEVYNQLGNGFLENVYQESMAIELSLRNIHFKEQVPLEIYYKNQPISHRYIADMIVFDKIILELKAISYLGANETAQLMHYLKATGLRLGLLVNFGSANKLEWKRIIL